MYEIYLISHGTEKKIGSAMSEETAKNIAYDFMNRLEGNGRKWLEVYGIHLNSAAEYNRFKNDVEISVWKLDENGKLSEPVELDD